MKHTLRLSTAFLVAMLLGFTAFGAATSTLGSINPIPAGAICQSSTTVPIYGFDIAVSGTTPNPNLTGFNFTTTGTYVATDINKFQLWYSTTNSFATATQLSTNITTALGTGTHTFAAFTQALTVGTTYYFWITVDATATAVYNHTLTVSALGTGNITVSAGAKAGTSAIGNTQTMSTPVVTITPASVARCVNDAANTLTAAGATTYTWLPATGLSSTTGASTSTTASTTTTYTVTGSVSGCSSTASRVVTVYANPTVAVSNAGPVCNTAITASGAGTYSWAPATGLSVTTGATVSPIPTVTTTYTVTGTTIYTITGTSCTSTANSTISATPALAITSGTVCASGTLTASGSVSGATISGYSWSPATGLAATTGASVLATPPSLTIYSVTATANNGCTANTTVTAGIPNVSVTPNAADGCTGVAQTYTATGAATFSWAPATYLGATTGAIVTATPTAAGTIVYTVTGTDSRGCTDTAIATSGAGKIALFPWTEGFESVTNTVLCNEFMGPNLANASAQEGTGSAATVQAASGTTASYGSAPVQIAAHGGSGLGGFGFHADNDYFFTPGFTLIAGNTYKFSFWYRIDGGLTYTDDYNATMVYNTTQSITASTPFTNFTTAVVPGSNAALTSGNLVAMQNATYQQWTGYFTPAAGGTYYFGINALNNNLTNTYYWGFDDVAFSQASNCVSPAAATSFSCSPATGTTTSLSITATADSFICIAIPNGSGAPTSAPVNGVNYSVGSSFGGGTIIGKGASSGITAASAGYFSPGTSYNLYAYTFQHDSCNGVAYSTSYTTTSSSPSFVTCTNGAPSTPAISSMLPGIGGVASVMLSGLPTTGTVTVYEYTNAAATVPASPASYSVTPDSSTLTISNASVYTGAHLWYTVAQTIAGCTVVSSASQQASIPTALPWSQNFETSSVKNLLTPNYMQSNLGFYTDQTSTVFGAEDKPSSESTAFVAAHSGSWDFLFFGGVTTSTSAPGTGAPYIPLAAYANQWLETPGLYCPLAGTYKLSFWYNNPSGSFPSINIQYSNIPTLPSGSSNTMIAATAIATVTPTLAGGWQQYTTTINIPSGPQTIFIGFDVAALSTSGYMAIDDIEVCEVPTISVTNSAAAGAVCTSGSLSLTVTPTPVAGVTSGSWNYTWAGPGTITSTAANATVTGLSAIGANPVYSVSTINTQDVYSVCASGYVATTATITPVPTAITGASTICGGLSSVYAGGATSGSPGWSITGAGSAFASGIVTSGYNLSTTSPSSQQIVSINYSNACGTSTPKTVTINVQPVAITASDFVSAPLSAICTLHTATYTDNTSGGTWSNTPTTYGTINSSIGVFNSTSSLGTTNISYTMATGGCAATTSVVVGNNGPTAITGGASSVCVGATTAAFASTPAGGVWSVSNTSVATISTVAKVTGIANTNGTPAVITYNTGCGTPVTTTFTVNGTSGSIATPATVCSGSGLVLSSTGITPSSGATYSWSGPNSFTSTLANPTVSATTLAANGIYTVTATKGVCSNAFTALGTVAQSPSTPTITATNPILCSGSATSLSATIGAETPQVFAIPVYTPTFAVSGTLNSSTTWTSGTSASGYYSTVIPFNFNFYGNTYNTLYIGSNGYVTFGAGSSLSATTAITAGTPGSVIALFQNPLTLASSGSIQYGVSGTAPNRQFVVYYNAVPGTTAGGPNSGYIVLNESTNVIDVIANAFNPNTSGKSTCGIANTAGAGGIAATGRNNVSYTITTPEAWRFYSLNNYNYSWAPSSSLVSANVASPVTTALAATTVYTLTVSDDISSACTSVKTYTVTADSSVALTLTNLQACIGASIVNMPYTAVSGSPSTYSISWTSGALDANFNDVTSAAFPGGTSGNIPITIGSGVTSGSIYQGTITFNNASSCPASYLFTVTIEAQPSLNLATLTGPSAATMCQGYIMNLNVSGASGGASPYLYTWKGPGITGTTTSSVPALVYTANVASSGLYSVSLSSSSTGCNTTPYLTSASTYTVLSSPTPTIGGFTASPSTLCAGTAMAFSVSASSGGTVYTWTGPNGYSATGTTATAAFTPTTSAASGVYSVTLTNTSSACASNPAVSGASLTVNPLPVAGTITGTATLCTSGTVTLNDVASGGTWSSSNISVASVSTAGVVTGVTAGTAGISYAVTNSCGTATVGLMTTVNSQPSITLTASATSLCSGGSEVLIATPSGGTGTSIYTWSGPAIVTSTGSTPTPAGYTPTVTTTTSGAYSVSVSYSGAGCNSANAASSTVTINTQPSVTLSASVTSLCSGGSETLTAAPVGGAGTATYTWSGPGIVTSTGATATPAAYTPMVASTTTSAYSVSVSYGGAGCAAANASSSSVTINTQPVISSVTSSSSSLCSGGSVTLTATETGGAGTPVYTWKGPGIATTTGSLASLATTPTVATTTTGAYSVSVAYSGAGCSGSATATTSSVTINTQPSVTLSASVTSLCSGGSETLTASPAGGAGIATYTWSGPGIVTATGTTATPAAYTPTVASATTGAYSVSVSYSGAGCTATNALSSSVTINTQPVISSVTSSSSSLCSGGSITLTATEAGGTGTPVYTWKGPGIATTTGSLASLSITPTVAATTTGAYSVSVAYSGTGCNSSATATTSSVTINTQPSVTLSASATSLCSGGSETLTASPAGGAGIATYTWSGPGIVTATGSTATPVAYTPTVASTTTGAYSVSVSYSGAGCTATNALSSSVTINTQPVISSVTSSSSGLCSGGSITLTATEAGGAGTPIYTWKGPGIATTTGSLASLAITPTVATTTTGAYSVSVVYSSAGCSGSATATTSAVTINTQPSITLGASVTSLCSGGSETLTASPAGGAGIATYTWSGPGIATATGATATPAAYTPTVAVTTTGAYSVSVSYSGAGCAAANASSSSVTINTQPSVTLNASATSLCSGGSETLTASPVGGAGTATYTWSGPGMVTSTGSTATPAAITPTVATTTTGAYSVSVAYSGAGCTTANASSSSVTISRQPSVTLSASATSLCSGGSETLTASPVGGAGAATYTWSGPGIATATGSTATPAAYTPTVASTTTGAYSVSVSYTGSGCSTASSSSSSVTISRQPSVTLSASATSLCSGGSETLTASPVGGAGTATYTWSGPGMATATGATATPAAYTPTVASTTTGAYSVSVSYSGAGCAAANASSSSVTINSQPSVTLNTSTAALCSGGSESLTAIPSGGVGSPTYTWSGPGIATVTGTTATPIAFTPTTSVNTSGAYSVSVTFPGSGCSTAHAVSSSVTLNKQPAVTLTPAISTLCIGITETLTANVTSAGVGTAAYTWSGPGISGSAGPFSSSVYTVTPGSGSASGAYSVSVSYTGTGCNTATNNTSIIPLTTQQWKGSANTSWNNAANWACGAVPFATQDVVIPGASAYTFAPTLDVATGYVHNLTVAATATLTLGSGNQLDLTGNFSNNAAITGSGLIYLNGSSAQVLSGNGTISNLTLANSAGAAIDTSSDTVGITGTLLLNSGTLTTQGSLVLVSNTNGDGSIGTITGGSISGNVVMQQYIPGGRRAYRFIAQPFSSSIPLSQIERTIDITGLGGASNGFTTTMSNAASAYWYNPLYGNSVLGVDPGWRAFTSAYGTPDSNMLHKYEGVRLMVRGAKGEGLTGATYTPDPVTYYTYGSVNTGAQTITLAKGTGANADYNLIGNPYPAITDIGTVINNANTAGQLTGSVFYVWDPYMSISGQFVAVTIGSPYYIGANQSFEVRAANNGNSLSFAESNKGNTTSAVLMRNRSEENLTLYVYDSSYHPWDMLNINFNNAATDNDDSKFDGEKPSSPAPLNFYSLSADDKKLTFDARPYTAGKTIPLGITSSYAQQFIIKAENVAVPDGGQVYLHDKYLQTFTLMTQGAEYKFTITKDSASQGNNRFELGLNTNGDAVADTKNSLEVQMVPNPASSEVTISYTANSKEKTSIRVMNMEGVTVMTQDLGIQQSGSNKITLDNLASGIYLVEFTSGSDKIVRRLVKE